MNETRFGSAQEAIQHAFDQIGELQKHVDSVRGRVYGQRFAYQLLVQTLEAQAPGSAGPLEEMIKKNIEIIERDLPGITNDATAHQFVAAIDELREILWSIQDPTPPRLTVVEGGRADDTH